MSTPLPRQIAFGGTTNQADYSIPPWDGISRINSAGQAGCIKRIPLRSVHEAIRFAAKTFRRSQAKVRCLSLADGNNELLEAINELSYHTFVAGVAAGTLCASALSSCSERTQRQVRHPYSDHFAECHCGAIYKDDCSCIREDSHWDNKPRLNEFLSDVTHSPHQRQQAREWLDALPSPAPTLSVSPLQSATLNPSPIALHPTDATSLQRLFQALHLALRSVLQKVASVLFRP
ncbi:MAG: hypothetical protein WC100_00785 [Sterolibacterium sp.]